MKLTDIEKLNQLREKYNSQLERLTRMMHISSIELYFAGYQAARLGDVNLAEVKQLIVDIEMKKTIAVLTELRDAHGIDVVNELEGLERLVAGWKKND